MKPVSLQFVSIAALAGFSRLVNDRGYVLIIKDLTLQTSLTDAEQQLALQQHGARLLPINRAAA